MTFTVNVDAAGTYPVNLRYANGPNPFSGPKTIALYVNGEKQSDWALPITSATDWKAWAFATRDLALQRGREPDHAALRRRAPTATSTSTR